MMVVGPSGSLVPLERAILLEVSEVESNVVSAGGVTIANLPLTTDRQNHCRFVRSQKITFAEMAAMMAQ
jgi:hypothetical protein